MPFIYLLPRFKIGKGNITPKINVDVLSLIMFRLSLLLNSVTENPLYSLSLLFTFFFHILSLSRLSQHTHSLSLSSLTKEQIFYHPSPSFSLYPNGLLQRKKMGNWKLQFFTKTKEDETKNPFFSGEKTTERIFPLKNNVKICKKNQDRLKV